MRLVEYEEELKKMIAEDVHDPKVYQAIYNLCYRWLLRMKHIYDRQKASDIATNMAEDLYMRILTLGTQSVWSWIGYINSLFAHYYTRWLNDNIKSQIIEPKSYSFELALVQMYAGSLMYDDSIMKIFNDDVIRSIPKLIESALDKSKFLRDTPEYLNAKTTLLLSIRLGKYVSFRQTPENESYTKILYKLVLEKLELDLRPEDCNEYAKALTFFTNKEDYNYLTDGGEQWML